MFSSAVGVSAQKGLVRRPVASALAQEGSKEVVVKRTMWWILVLAVLVTSPIFGAGAREPAKPFFY